MILEAVVVTASMFVLASVPLFWPQARVHNDRLMLFGTGALLGICVFDLFPDFYKMGGKTALPLFFAAWAIYSLAHLFHDHNHNRFSEESSRSPYIFLSAITAHCFASGLLLGVSDQFSKHMAESVFAALMVHKIFESLAVSLLLLSFNRRITWTISMLAIYLLSFPAGAGMAEYYGHVNHLFLLIISGVAIGSLAGCLVFDFILPSVRFIKQKSRQSVFWLAAGLILTAILIR